MDKVYRIWSIKSEQELAKEVRLQESFSGNKYPVYTYDFWKSIAISEYDPDLDLTTFIFYDEFGNVDTKFYFKTYAEVWNFFQHVDLNNSITYLGNSAKSYSAAWLNLICWATDVAWCKQKWSDLVNDK